MGQGRRRGALGDEEGRQGLGWGHEMGRDMWGQAEVEAPGAQHRGGQVYQHSHPSYLLEQLRFYWERGKG